MASKLFDELVGPLDLRVGQRIVVGGIATTSDREMITALALEVGMELARLLITRQAPRHQIFVLWTFGQVCAATEGGTFGFILAAFHLELVQYVVFSSLVLAVDAETRLQ